MQQKKITAAIGVALLAAATSSSFTANAAPTVTGGTLNPANVPKYVTPLVIPPVMNNSGTTNDYNIAVRQFQQQILPGGIWNSINGRSDTFAATTVWSYGPAAEDPVAVSGLVAPSQSSQFNYPSFTIEATTGTSLTVDWINDLKDPVTGNHRPHLLAVDQSLHWANPGAEGCAGGPGTIDCRNLNGPNVAVPYTGPVPIVTHVHGAHTGPDSDGYPEAWWLPDPSGSDFSCVDPSVTPPDGVNTFACEGSLANQFGTTPNTNATSGVGHYTYTNDQPSTTLWYHDHSLGMTRLNVYAGPAGFWLIRPSGGGEDGLVSGALPGPAPVAGKDPNFVVADRAEIREIPIVIQDRSFNADSSLFYPDNRAFFQELRVNQMDIPFIGDPDGRPSDISPIWNPEAFFNMMVVNGTTWPTLDVEPDLYRFRLLNGCNSRFLNLSLSAMDAAGNVLGEVPFYQIGAEQGLMPNVVRIQTGEAVALAGDGTEPTANPNAADMTALLMGPAERADVIVDFTNLPANTAKVRMLNTAPDAPFGGFPDVPADTATTGQVMEFTLIADDLNLGEDATPPRDLVLSLPDAGDKANLPGTTAVVRDLALIEEESEEVCVKVQPNGNIHYLKKVLPGVTFLADCAAAKGVPMAPKAAVLGVDGATATPLAQMWSDPIAQNPTLGDTETWEIWNHTVDAHPIHIHLVKFKVQGREVMNGATRDPEPWEAGWKDTVIAYPQEVTRVKATFDTAGLYVWHCHIVEHEDNEMMVPFCVGDLNANGCAGL